MLQLRPNCECCDVDLPPHADACICSFECTFCADCCARLNAICPNCGGERVARPIRPASSGSTSRSRPNPSTAATSTSAKATRCRRIPC